MRKFKFMLDRRTLEKIYLTFIRPLLEYGNVVWDCKTVYLTNKLESVRPKCLFSDTMLMILLPIMSGGISGRLDFLDTIILSVLSGLNLTSH
jgi:hypothetical protein